MKKFNTEMEPMLDVFIAEAKGLCDNITLSLEHINNKHISAQDIENIFRAIHTIKGSFSIMGMDSIANFSHKLEDLLDELRNNKEIFTSFGKEYMQLLYAYTDFIYDEIDSIATQDAYTQKSTDSLIQFADKLAVTIHKPTSGESAQGSPVPSLPSNPNYLERNHKTIFFEADCDIPCVRAAMLIKKIRPLCTFLEHTPDVFAEASDKMDAYILQHGINISFASANLREVLAQIEKSPFVERCVDTMHEKVPVEEDNVGQQTKQMTAITVDVEKISALQTLVVNLALSHTMLQNMLTSPSGQLTELLERQHQIISELEERIIGVGMLPLGQMHSQLQRLVRDIASELGKQISFIFTGGDIEVDRFLIERLPLLLTHLIRNAADHGIETPQERIQQGKPPEGTLQLQVEPHGSALSLVLSDDGRGINRAKVIATAQQRGLLQHAADAIADEEVFSFILRPNFSTAQRTTRFSGRGVGMDAVQASIGEMGGHMTIRSEEGKGTSIHMHLPISLTLIESVLFSAADMTFLLPVRSVLHMDSVQEAEASLYEREGRTFYAWEGKYLPVIRLHEFYERPSTQSEQDGILLIVEGLHSTICIMAHCFIELIKVIVKGISPLAGPRLQYMAGIMGYSVLHNGRIAYMLGAESLIQASLASVNPAQPPLSSALDRPSRSQ